MKRTRLSIKLGMVGMALVALVACGQKMQAELIDESSFDVLGLGGSDDIGSDNPQGAVNPQGKAIQTGEQMLQSMLSLAGVTTVSTAVDGVYKSRVGSLPVGRDMNLITAPMWISATNVAGSICNEVIAAEKAKAAASRLYFNSLNFANGSAQLSDTVMSDIIGRMARAFWARSPDSEELSSLATFKSEFFAVADTTAASTEKFMVGLCTAMLSSFDVLIY